MKRKDFKLLVENWNNFLLNEGNSEPNYNEREGRAGSRKAFLNNYIEKLKKYLEDNAKIIGDYEFNVTWASKGSDVLEALFFGKADSGSTGKADVKDIVTNCADKGVSEKECIEQCRNESDAPRYAKD